MKEFAVTVNPDPKRKHGGKSWTSLSPKRQYNMLAYTIAKATRSILKKYCSAYKFVFEIGSNGCIHAHGTLEIQDDESNLYAMKMRLWKLKIAETFSRNHNNEYYVNVCCTVRNVVDQPVSEKWASWNDYLHKYTEKVPDWMRPIDHHDLFDISDYIELGNSDNSDLDKII